MAWILEMQLHCIGHPVPNCMSMCKMSGKTPAGNTVNLNRWASINVYTKIKFLDVIVHIKSAVTKLISPNVCRAIQLWNVQCLWVDYIFRVLYMYGSVQGSQVFFNIFMYCTECAYYNSCGNKNLKIWMKYIRLITQEVL